MDSEADKQSEPVRLHCPSSDSPSKPLISKQNRDDVSIPQLPPLYLQNWLLILLMLFAFCCFGVAIFIGLTVNFNHTSYDVNRRLDDEYCPCLVPHLKGVRTSLSTPQLVPTIEVTKATHLHSHPLQSTRFKWKLEPVPKGHKPHSSKYHSSKDTTQLQA